jgi:hypothetical protein
MDTNIAHLVEDARERLAVASQETFGELDEALRAVFPGETKVRYWNKEISEVDYRVEESFDVVRWSEPPIQEGRFWNANHFFIHYITKRAREVGAESGMDFSQGNGSIPFHLGNDVGKEGETQYAHLLQEGKPVGIVFQDKHYERVFVVDTSSE